MSLLEGSAVPSAAKKEIALEGANPDFFTNIDPVSHLPILNQAALDKALKGKRDLTNTHTIQNSMEAIGWNSVSDSGGIKRGALVLGLKPETTAAMGGGKIAGSSWNDLVNAAKQVGIDPTKFSTTSTGMDRGIKRTTTTNDSNALYKAIDNKLNDVYAVTNSIGGTKGANSLQPHATILFKADGKGNLVPLMNQETNKPIAQNFKAVRVVHQGAAGQLAVLSPFIMGASLALPTLAPQLTAALSGLQVGGATLGATLGATGTAALSNAIVNAGMAALTGGDALKGALVGGITGAASVGGSDLVTKLVGSDTIDKISSITNLNATQVTKILANGAVSGLTSAVVDPENIGVNMAANMASGFASQEIDKLIKDNIDVPNANVLANAASKAVDVATNAAIKDQDVSKALENSAQSIVIGAAKDLASNQPANIGNQTFPVREDIGKEKETALADLINLPKSSDDLSGDAKDIYNHYVSNGLDKDTALVLASSADPKFQNPELGTQLGDPTAGLTGGITLDKPTASDVPIDLPKVDLTPVIQRDKTLPDVEVTAGAEKPLTGAEQLQETPVDINQTNKDILGTILGNQPTTDQTVDTGETNPNVDINSFTSDPDVMDHYINEAINGLNDIGITNPTKTQIDTAALQLLQSDANTIFNPTTSQPTTPIKVDEDKSAVVDETKPTTDITKDLEGINKDNLDVNQVVNDIISNPTNVDTTDNTVVDDTKLPIVDETKPTTDIVDVLKNTDTDKKDVNEVIKDILTNPTNVDTNETTDTTDATGKTDTTDTVDTTGATDTVDTIIGGDAEDTLVGGDAEDTLNLEDILKDPNAEVTDGKIDVDTDVLAGTGENTITGGTTEDELTDTTLPKDENAGVTDGEVEVDLDLLDPDGDILNPDDIPEDPNQKPYDETDPDVDPDVLDPKVIEDKAAADKVVADRYAAEKADRNRRLSAYESLLGIGSLPSGAPTQVKPDLADVFYFGKDFSTPMQSISKTGELVQSPYKGLSVSQKGKEIASSGGTGENDVYNLLNEIMSKGNKTSLNDLLEILGGV
jgi:hypothetical protein